MMVSDRDASTVGRARIASAHRVHFSDQLSERLMLHVDPGSHSEAIPIVESDEGRPGARAASSLDGFSATGGTAVIICTRGRPDIVRALVSRLAEQTMPPEHVFIIAAIADDIAGLNRNQANLTVRIGRTGLTLQRNDGLALAGSRFGSIVFFDDDFVPSRFWLERMAEIFASRPDIAGLTGIVMADGTTTPGVPLNDAESVFEKGRLLHGQRLMSVAVAAMVMRVSATAVSCS